jgi:succinate-acetate transporter protein
MGVVANQILFDAFGVVAFFKFIIFAILELRYLMVIWKARSPDDFATTQAQRSQLCALYLRFYGILVLGMVIMYQLQFAFPLLLCLAYSYWVPQIVENAIHNHREALHEHYIMGITLSRLAIPLYFYGCPDKFITVRLRSLATTILAPGS